MAAATSVSQQVRPDQAAQLKYQTLAKMSLHQISQDHLTPEQQLPLWASSAILAIPIARFGPTFMAIISAIPRRVVHLKNLGQGNNQCRISCDYICHCHSQPWLAFRCMRVRVVAHSSLVQRSVVKFRKCRRFHGSREDVLAYLEQPPSCLSGRANAHQPRRASRSVLALPCCRIAYKHRNHRVIRQNQHVLAGKRTL